MDEGILMDGARRFKRIQNDGKIQSPNLHVPCRKPEIHEIGITVFPTRLFNSYFVSCVTVISSDPAVTRRDDAQTCTDDAAFNFQLRY